MTPEVFLTWERQQGERHVFFRGQVFAMAGGSPRHSLLASRLITEIGVALRGKPCDVHSSDLRLGLDDSHFVYADAVVACRPLALRPGSTDVVLNPRVVIEVLSKGTERYDRGEKQAGYLALPSVEHLVLVSQREPRVEVYSRESDGAFQYRVYEQGSSVQLDRIGVAIAVNDLYAGAFELPGDDGSEGVA
jgi:Uma2 family endonuclease